MDSGRAIAFGAGLCVAAGLAALLLMAVKLGTLGGWAEDGGYRLSARFANVGGLKVRAPVTMAGVRVGRVVKIEFDSETYEAVTTLSIQRQYDRIPKDTSASILTAGLGGEQYIGLELGGARDYLADGDELRLTQSALILEQLISRFLYDRAGPPPGAPMQDADRAGR